MVMIAILLLGNLIATILGIFVFANMNIASEYLRENYSEKFVDNRVSIGILMGFILSKSYLSTYEIKEDESLNKIRQKILAYLIPEILLAIILLITLFVFGI